MTDVVATCLDVAVVRDGLAAIGYAFGPHEPLDVTLTRILERTGLGAGAITLAGDQLTFTGAAQRLADLLSGAARGAVQRQAASTASRASLQGVTGWAALGAAVVTAGTLMGPALFERLRTFTAPPKKRPRQKHRKRK